MSRRVSDEEKALRGTKRPSRSVISLFGPSGPDPENVPPPAGMTPAGRKAWIEKVERYRQRGQRVRGFEDSLRAYCELEAMLNGLRARGCPVPAAAINAYRLWAGDFYDLPARAAPKRRG